MKIYKTATIMAIFLFSFSAGCIFFTPLEYKFPTGSKLNYKITNEIKQVTTAMGQEQVNAINTAENMHILGLEAVDDDNFKVEFYLDKVSINMVSDIPQLNLGVLDFSFIENKKSSAFVSKKGVVSFVEAIDIIDFEGPIAQSFAQQYNPVVFFSKFFLLLPANDLTAGETWSDSRTETNEVMSGEVSLHTDYFYTISEILDYKGYSCLKIVSSIKIIFLGQGNQGGNEFSISGNGEGEGLFYFARNEGIIVDYEITQTNNLNMDFAAMKMTIPTKTSIFSKVELVK